MGTAVRGCCARVADAVMVMFPSGVRVEDQPSQWLPLHADPDAERARLRRVLREAREATLSIPTGADWPKPEVAMRVVEAGALRGAPARVLKALRSAGWRTVVTYARGTTFDAQRRPGAVVGSWAIRAAKGKRRATAIWWERNGRLESRSVLVWGDRPAQWVGISEFEKGI